MSSCLHTISSMLRADWRHSPSLRGAIGRAISQVPRLLSLEASLRPGSGQEVVEGHAKGV